MADFQAQPGALAEPSAQWPPEAALPHEDGRNNLLVFVHPRCACSRATATELAEFLAHHGHAVSLRVVLVRPDASGPHWEDEPLVRSLAALPGARMVVDASGDDAVRFGALTSGHVTLYDGAGRHLFAGGITSGRGHEGDNPGRDLLERALAGTGRALHPAVYGCRLREVPSPQPAPCETGP